jgi:hypothetical protein
MQAFFNGLAVPARTGEGGAAVVSGVTVLNGVTISMMDPCWTINTSITDFGGSTSAVNAWQQ